MPSFTIEYATSEDAPAVAKRQIDAFDVAEADVQARRAFMVVRQHHEFAGYRILNAAGWIERPWRREDL
ncbi:MAG: hypothetical protein JOY71_10010 [Acetobacteraceae bacterium]|nr:hypothetical protein [Acetobacteraceae bacterium]